MAEATEEHYARYTTAFSVGISLSSDSLFVVRKELTWYSVDVPMSKVKFNVNTEYAYIQNMKILQSMSKNFFVSCESKCLRQTPVWGEDVSE